MPICKKIIYIVLSILSGASQISYALVISPVLIELTKSAPVASLSVENNSNEIISFQTNIFSWSQDGDRDVYQESDKLFVVPAISSIQPNTLQIFRITLTKPIPRDKELAFRLLLEDITEDSEKTRGDILKFRLNHNLPVFVLPMIGLNALIWSSCEAQSAKGCMRLDNKGNKRLRISSITLQGKDWKRDLVGSGTVLSGAWKKWTYENINNKSLPLNISLTTEQGVIVVKLNELLTTDATLSKLEQLKNEYLNQRKNMNGFIPQKDMDKIIDSIRNNDSNQSSSSR
jgi:fimbrial chaperone protein